jgi:hypothetical protein
MTRHAVINLKTESLEKARTVDYFSEGHFDIDHGHMNYGRNT